MKVSFVGVSGSSRWSGRNALDYGDEVTMTPANGHNRYPPLKKRVVSKSESSSAPQQWYASHEQQRAESSYAPSPALHEPRTRMMNCSPPGHCASGKNIVATSNAACGGGGRSSELQVAKYATPPAVGSTLAEDDQNSQEGLENFGFMETPAMLERAKQQLFEAISLMAPSQKAVYEEAMNKCPELVATESDPIGFLRREQFNSWAAARRLTSHWTARKRIFGSARAFLPLNLSGDGALTQDDIAVLKTGFLALLPPDKLGRRVIFFNDILVADHPHLDKAAHRIMRHRCCFYLLYRLSAEESSRRAGICLIRFSNRPYILYKNPINKVSEMFDSAAVELKCFFSIFKPPPGARGLFETALLPLYFSALGSSLKSQAIVHFVDCNQRDVCRFLLERHECLCPRNIPVGLGGTWSYHEGPTSFVTWMNARFRLERANPVPSSRPSADCGASTHISQQLTSGKKPSIAGRVSHSPARGGKNPPQKRPRRVKHEGKAKQGRDPESKIPGKHRGPLDLSNPADVAKLMARKERKRKMDAIYARKRREREKAAEEELHAKCSRFSQQNMKLEQENKMLEQLLECAKEQVAKFENQGQQASCSSSSSAPPPPSSLGGQQLHKAGGKIGSLLDLCGTSARPGAANMLTTSVEAPSSEQVVSKVSASSALQGQQHAVESMVSKQQHEQGQGADTITAAAFQRYLLEQDVPGPSNAAPGRTDSGMGAGIDHNRLSGRTEQHRPSQVHNCGYQHTSSHPNANSHPTAIAPNNTEAGIQQQVLTPSTARDRGLLQINNLGSQSQQFLLKREHLAVAGAPSLVEQRDPLRTSTTQLPERFLRRVSETESSQSRVVAASNNPNLSTALLRHVLSMRGNNTNSG